MPWDLDPKPNAPVSIRTSLIFQAANHMVKAPDPSRHHLRIWLAWSCLVRQYPLCGSPSDLAALDSHVLPSREVAIKVAEKCMPAVMEIAGQG